MAFAGLMVELLKVAVFAGLLIAGALAIHIWQKNKSKKISYLRLFIQLISQAAIFYLISFPLWLSVFLATLLLMTLFFGRFFCGWICPFGFYMDLISLLRQTLKTRYLNLPPKLNTYLNNLRYLLLAFFLGAPLVLMHFNSHVTSSDVIFLSGVFNPARILLGPLVPLVAPWQILGSNLNYPYFDQIVYYAGSQYALVAVLVFVGLTVLASFFVRRFWCRFCPTGASFAVASKLRGFGWAPLLHLEKSEEKCTKCGICRRVCTVQAQEVYDQKGGKIDSSICMLCLRCVEMCPYDGCLKLNFANKNLLKSRNWLEPPKEPA
ncbi:MAG: 4Fe-4S binding protein [Candidatus Bathyarchaeota archaeon]|nr:4Fe-4S binding protein [Candidatus Bathyarchaeota archaeon]